MGRGRKRTEEEKIRKIAKKRGEEYKNFQQKSYFTKHKAPVRTPS
jgi:hypothetical protein